MTTPNKNASIMIVDDEATARISLAEILRLEGYQVSTAASGEESMSLLQKSEQPFDLIVLDLKMPGMDGLEVTQAIHKQSPGTVVILLTAFATLETAVQAIREGAHDYLIKPCPIPEILESVHKGLEKRKQEQKRQHLVSQLKHTLTELAAVEGADIEGETQLANETHNRFIRIDNFMIDRQKHVATLHGEPLDLTPTEFKILTCLIETPNQVWSPQELVRRAQGYETDAWGARAIVRVHIRRLRKKVEKEPSNPQYIINKRGVGYMFSASTTEKEGSSDS